MRKKTLSIAAGFVILGLSIGTVPLRASKEKDMDSKENGARPAEVASAGGQIDASPQKRFETATFAMG